MKTELPTPKEYKRLWLANVQLKAAYKYMKEQRDKLLKEK
jgi:hypothetical protein